MAQKMVPNDIIPLRAGIVRLTPYDALGVLKYDLAVTTQRDFVTSITHNTARTFETLPNGNGQDAEFATEEVHNIALATNVYDHNFHSTVAGMKPVVTPRIVLHDITVVPDQSAGTFVFENANEYPVATEDEKVHFEIRDNHGNLLKENVSTPSGEYEYQYSAESHTLTFHEGLKGAELSCVYYIEATAGIGYEADPIIKKQMYKIEVMGEVQSVKTAERVLYYGCLTKGTTSGDIPDVATQKAITNTITYNFKSAPVPAGVTPWYQSMTPIADAPAAAKA